jgi:hypothetical protein
MIVVVGDQGIERLKAHDPSVIQPPLRHLKK